MQTDPTRRPTKPQGATARGSADRRKTSARRVDSCTHSATALRPSELRTISLNDRGLDSDDVGSLECASLFSITGGSPSRSGLTDVSSSTPPASYPEENAKTHTTKNNLEPPCPSYKAVAGSCENGHKFAREIYCGREWCPTCGAKGSEFHQRRKARWYPKLQQCRQVGYLVVTIPPRIRDQYRTKEALGEVGISIKRLLQRQGLSRGVRRFHFFGEQIGQEVPQYHPHLNCLIDHGYLEERKLEAIRRGLARILGIGVEEVNLHYEYSSEVPKILHWITYVLRATFLDWRWDPELAAQLVGFRNGAPWGKWLDDEGEPLPAVWEIPEAPAGDQCHETRQIADLEACRCPICKGKITWGGIIFRDRLLEKRRGFAWEKIGGGYWMQGDP